MKDTTKALSYDESEIKKATTIAETLATLMKATCDLRDLIDDRTLDIPVMNAVASKLTAYINKRSSKICMYALIDKLNDGNILEVSTASRVFEVFYPMD